MSIKISLFILVSLAMGATFPLKAFASPLEAKKTIIDKYLKTKNPFDKKVKALVAFQSWADKEILSNSDKLSEVELAQLMQYSNLLKSITPEKLTPKNCKSAPTKVLESDLSPVSEKASPPAQVIISWLKSLCP